MSNETVGMSGLDVALSSITDKKERAKYEDYFNSLDKDAWKGFTKHEHFAAICTKLIAKGPIPDTTLDRWWRLLMASGMNRAQISKMGQDDELKEIRETSSNIMRDLRAWEKTLAEETPKDEHDRLVEAWRINRGDKPREQS